MKEYGSGETEQVRQAAGAAGDGRQAGKTAFADGPDETAGALSLEKFEEATEAVSRDEAGLQRVLFQSDGK